MNLTPNNNNNNNNNNSNQNNSNNNSSNSNQSNNSDDEQEQDQEQNQEANTSSSDFNFNQETLRKRIAGLNSSSSTNHQQPSDVNNRKFKDVTIFSDSTSHYIEEENAEIVDDKINESEMLEFMDTLSKVRKVWVIIFTNSSDGTEGIYSLSVDNENIILGFEEKFEAQRYVISLERQQFPQPQVIEMDAKNLQEFCDQGNFKLGFVPKGRIILPPEQSVIENLDQWKGNPSDQSNSTGMTQDDIDTMRKRLDSLFGQ